MYSKSALLRTPARHHGKRCLGVPGSGFPSTTSVEEMLSGPHFVCQIYLVDIATDDSLMDQLQMNAHC
jgi:hypothetical protein